MKQFLIGLGVLAVLVVYSLGVRHEQPVLTKPAAVAATSSTSGGANNTATNPSSNASSSNAGGSGPTATSHGLKNGTYTGSVEDAYYGNVQVSATISGGKLTDVTFLQYPDTHQDSVMINQQAMPWLKQEAIQKQSAHVDIISGATFTSQAFIQSLDNALNQAQSA